MKIGMLLSIVSTEQKMLFEAAAERGVVFDRMDDRRIVFDLENHRYDHDVILERCVNHSRALYSLKMLNASGIRTVNSYDVARVCGNKFLTTMALVDHGVPTPKARVAFTAESALEEMESMGYPVVLKPPIGSWGRLIARINDRHAAESGAGAQGDPGILSPFGVLYPEVRGEARAGYPVLRGGRRDHLRRLPLFGSLEDQHRPGGDDRGLPRRREVGTLSARAAEAVGGGVVAVDLLESPEGIQVNEVNYTMEFRNSVRPTGVDIPGRIIDYLVKVAES